METLDALYTVGVIYQARGRYADSEALHVDVVRAIQEALGQWHPRTLETSLELAQTRRRQGKYQEADAAIIQTRKDRRRSHRFHLCDFIPSIDTSRPRTVG